MAVWLLPFCYWLGAQGDLVSGLFFLCCFFFLFFGVCCYQWIWVGHLPNAKTKTNNFSQRLVIATSSACTGSAISGNTERYLWHFPKGFPTPALHSPSSCHVCGLQGLRKASWGISVLNSLHGTRKHNSMHFQTCFVSRCHLMVHWSPIFLAANDTDFVLESNWE